MRTVRLIRLLPLFAYLFAGLWVGAPALAAVPDDPWIGAVGVHGEHDHGARLTAGDDDVAHSHETCCDTIFCHLAGALDAIDDGLVPPVPSLAPAPPETISGLARKPLLRPPSRSARF